MVDGGPCGSTAPFAGGGSVNVAAIRRRNENSRESVYESVSIEIHWPMSVMARLLVFCFEDPCDFKHVQI